MARSPVPPTNARLTRIEGSGFTENYDQAAGADTAKWTGSAPAQVTERVLSNVDGQQLDQALERRLVIPADLADPKPGDTVAWTKGGVQGSGRVRSIEERSDYGFVRLYLWTE